MADHTHIEWTDATWNPITGCSVVSPGCTNCYAMKLAGGRLKHIPSRVGLTQETKAGPVWTGEVRLNGAWIHQPISWTRPRRIFVCAHGDLFHENVPDKWIDRVFAVMACAPQHAFQVLTKRSARMRAYFDGAPQGRWLYFMDSLQKRPAGHGVLLPTQDGAMPNVWLGVSAEDQTRADERIPDLLATPAAVRFLSAEPLLGPMDLYNGAPDPRLGGHQARHTFIGDWWEPGDDPNGPSRHGLDWVIVGGESGPGARPTHPAWVQSLRDQCDVADVAFFFKQWGAWRPDDDQVITEADGSGQPFVAWPDGAIAHGRADDHGGPGLRLGEVGKKAAGRLLDGRTHDAMPEVAA